MELYTLEKSAEILELSVATVRRYSYTGVLEYAEIDDIRYITGRSIKKRLKTVTTRTEEFFDKNYKKNLKEEEENNLRISNEFNNYLTKNIKYKLGSIVEIKQTERNVERKVKGKVIYLDKDIFVVEDTHSVREGFRNADIFCNEIKVAVLN